jgi:5-oxoprolinase (ATP-hydrolysing)
MDSEASTKKWQFWIDRGGTFTDIVAQKPDSSVVTHKLLSVNPERYSDAATHGIKELLGLKADDAIPGDLVDVVKMGTTVGTNALLERKGEPTVLAVTKGFRDLLRIAYQNRPNLFDLQIKRPDLLCEEIIEINERVLADGTIEKPLDEISARADFLRMRSKGYTAIAIVCLHGYRYHAHEKRLAELAREVGFAQVSVSHQVSPLVKAVGRGDTTVVDAYLSPVLRRYVNLISDQLDGARLMFMQSNGGLADAQRFQGKDSVLSGPAGGTVGAAKTASMAGFNRIIGFDMGGTSTDVSHYAGEYERAFETLVAGVRMRAPMMRIHTVAAGGGSILAFENGRFRVGPESAGANPGPASYRRGGPLTVTDCNVVMGRLQPSLFPSVFGVDGNLPLDADAARSRFQELAETMKAEMGGERTIEDIAAGYLQIAVENMANAIKEISIRRGYDVTEYALCCFGGAGGQHACLIADTLGMETVFIHPYAGVLSAYGMGLADIRSVKERSIELPLDQDALLKIQTVLAELGFEAKAEIQPQLTDSDHLRVEERLHVRYDGTDSSLEIPLPQTGDIAAEVRRAFEDEHRKRYGFIMEGKALVVAVAVAEAIGETDVVEEKAQEIKSDVHIAPIENHSAYIGGTWKEIPFYIREEMQPGSVIDGPAVIVERTGANVIEPGWQAEITALNHLVMKRLVPIERSNAIGTEVDPVLLEVFNNLFMSVAEQMGAALENTAYSVNIKERLDFSCAIFDPDGNLVANAPHVPVHLGSMGASVRTIIRERRGAMNPGDFYALNDPYNGGTHLPDITVVAPVFDDDEIIFFVAARGHHADVGGLTPGSMPPDSTHIEHEGVLINNFLLVNKGTFQQQALEDLLLSAKYPARNIYQNEADLKAQIAACEKGVREVRRMIDHFGLGVVQAYMKHVQDNAEESVRRVIGALESGSFDYALDNGAVVAVDISINSEARTAKLDFSRSSAQLSSNFNAPAAVCRAAVLYVFRMLVGQDIPLNDGCLKPIEIIVPEGSMLNPRQPAAVVAGNVETSQVVTDTILGALGVMGACQGTMNNFTFGDKDHQYYETICGGAGAGPTWDGVSAIHTHMTNTRLTDPEILELRYPVILESFGIRPGSGGAGRNKGGDGIIRRIRFQRKMTAAILSNRREVAPYGMSGGEPGQCGENRVERSDGKIEYLKGADQAEMQPGDTFIIETPGGGGYGTVN